jgi:hypothetical protein
MKTLNDKDCSPNLQSDVDKVETARRSYRGMRLGCGRQGADHLEQFLEVDLELGLRSRWLCGR